MAHFTLVMLGECAKYFPSHVSFKEALVPKISESIGTIGQALSRYGSSGVVCFNGGKDSTVLLDLVTRVGRKLTGPVKIRPFYLNTPDEFGEILSFLEESEKFWKIELLRLKTPSLKDGLRTLIEKYGTKAVFLGVRKSDFDQHVAPFERTTKGWPHAMRVSPILNWSYHDIWNYIESLSIPVCELYKKGFTSIGKKIDTKPNPSLWCEREHAYLHARHLANPEEERKGRH